MGEREVVIDKKKEQRREEAFLSAFSWNSEKELLTGGEKGRKGNSRTERL